MIKPLAQCQTGHKSIDFVAGEERAETGYPPEQFRSGRRYGAVPAPRISRLD